MTVIAMSRTEIDRMSVLQDLAANRIKVAEAATLMSLGRRQVFRLAKAYSRQSPEALVSCRRGRPSNRSYPADLRDAAVGIIREPVTDPKLPSSLPGLSVPRRTATSGSVPQPAALAGRRRVWFLGIVLQNSR
jgi:hypothetical protein